MYLRDKLGRFTNWQKKAWKIIGYGAIAVAVLFALAFLLEKYGDYRAKKDWVWRFPIEIRTHKILTIKDINPVVIQPWVEEVDEFEIANPIEQKIYDLWGDRYYLLALSTFKCESGLNPEAVNWTTKDIGVSQINYPIWKQKIQDKFGYSLVDLFDYEKNLEVAYWIWDRADGTEGNNEGSFKPWVVYGNGSFVNCIE